MSKRTGILCLLAILALGIFFRFYLLTEIPLGLYPDEAMNGNNALEALATGNFRVFYPENNGREGLFINLQAFAIKFLGAEPWVLRLVSAIFGTLAILGIYLLTKELFWGYRNINLGVVALLSSFFLATSFWHLNFSRIGFRAIMVPFFASFGMYFLLKGLRRGGVLDITLAGIFSTLGFYTYIAFRFMPAVFAVPILSALASWWRAPRETFGFKKNCVPCLVLLFILVSLAVFSPLGIYFLQNPQDFLGRADDISILSTESPFKEFIKSNVATLGMFFWKGDCNWRHNFACQPELNPIVAVLFIFGVVWVLYDVLIRRNFSHPAPLTLLAWFIFLTLPATLTYEGLPHALRSIGLIIPVMIISGLGAWLAGNKILQWIEEKKTKFPERAGQLDRIKKELKILFILILLFIPLTTYRDYFLRWAHNPETYFSFATDTWHLGKFLNELPADTPKYVIANLTGVYVRGITMPAQTIMFATNTFGDEEKNRKNITYLMPEDLDKIPAVRGRKYVITLLNGTDLELVRELKKRFPELRPKAPGDFIIFSN